MAKTTQITVELTQRQFGWLQHALSPRPAGVAQRWLSPIVVPVLVTALGAVLIQQITEHYSEHQRLLAQAEAAGKYIQYFADGTAASAQQRYLAVQSLVQIGNYDAAADLLGILKWDYRGAKAVLENGSSSRNRGKRREDKDDANSDVTPTEDDRVVSYTIVMYADQLLPRFCYLVGLHDRFDQTLQEDLPDFTDPIGTETGSSENLAELSARAKGFSRRSIGAVMLLSESDDGLQKIAELAVPWMSQPTWFSWQADQLAALVRGNTESSRREQLERHGALLALKAKIDEARAETKRLMHRDSTLAFMLKRFTFLRAPLERAVMNPSSVPYSATERALALKIVADLDGAWLTPSPHVAWSRDILLNQSEANEVREAAMEVVLNSADVSPETINALQSIVRGPATDESAVLIAQLIGFEHSDYAPRLGADLRARWPQNNEIDDPLLRLWIWRGRDDALELIDAFPHSPRHRQIAIMSALSYSTHDDAIRARVTEFVRAHSKDADAEIRARSFGILLLLDRPNRVATLAAALQDPSAFVVRELTLRIRKNPAECALVPIAEKRLTSPETGNLDPVSDEVIDVVTQRCEKRGER
jgi:hypothetical protein